VADVDLGVEEQRGIPVQERRVALAGYRLADLLEAILKD
jgi:hypothetical protein